MPIVCYANTDPSMMIEHINNFHRDKTQVCNLGHSNEFTTTLTSVMRDNPQTFYCYECGDIQTPATFCYGEVESFIRNQNPLADGLGTEERAFIQSVSFGEYKPVAYLDTLIRDNHALSILGMSKLVGEYIHFDWCSNLQNLCTNHYEQLTQKIEQQSNEWKKKHAGGLADLADALPQI